MAALVWDKTGERFYETGVDHGVLYVQKASREANDNTWYENGIAWNGLTAVNESPDGAEPNDLYADNIKYATLRSAETFGATIEAYMFPDEFAQCDGAATISPGVYFGQQSRKPFGFVYRTNVGNDTASEDDDGYKLHIIYNATASPSEKNYETVNDSPDAITMSWEIATTPVPVSINGKSYKPLSTITIDSTKCDKSKLETLEAILFGSASEEPRLPDPEEVYTTMT